MLEGKSVGFVGVGRMGRPMSGHMLTAGVPLTVFDPDPEAVREVIEKGATAAASAAEVAAASDVVLVMAGFFDQVADAVRGTDGILTAARPGTTVVIASTLTPEQMVDLAASCAEQGVHVLDAPVCQGERGAVAGRLVWLVGGERSVLDDVRDVLATCGDEIFHLGTIGAGMAAKALNNMLLWAALVADHEAMAIAKFYDLQQDELLAALTRSSGANWPLENWHEIRSIPWAHKDMRIVLEMADRAGLSLPLAGLLREQVKPLMAQAGMNTDLTR